MGEVVPKLPCEVCGKNLSRDIERGWVVQALEEIDRRLTALEAARERDEEIRRRHRG